MRKKDLEHLKPKWQLEPTYKAYIEAQTAFETYKVSLNGATDSKLDELQAAFLTKQAEWQMECIQRAAKINFNPTLNGRGTHIF